MKAVRAIAFGICLLLSMSIATYAQKVTVDYDKAASFAGIKTYAWAKGTPATNPLMDQRIIQNIDKQLAAKGLSKVNANPDVLVAYHAAIDVETQVNTTDLSYGGYYGWGPGWGPAWGGGTSTTSIQKIPIGTLAVNIGTAKDKKLLWVGKATDDLSDKPEKVEKTIIKATEKMFKKFPPPPAK